MYGAYGVVAALHERERTGRGQVVRTSLLAAIVGVHAFQGTAYTVAHEVPRPTGGHHPSICPVRAVRRGRRVRADRGRQRPALGRLRGRFGLLGRNGRPTRSGSPIARRWSPRSTPRSSSLPAAELLAMLDEIGVPAGKVRNIGEVYEWDQTRRRAC